MLHVLFFGSGLASLVYQVCWVRQFGNVFGNTVYSASLVTAVFMLGLGVGSRVAGGWADRRLGRAGAVPALYRTYAGVELLVGAIGLLLATALPRLGGLSVALSAYTADARGWQSLSASATAARYVFATVMVLPPTLLMGATLTLLVRATVASDVGQAGYRIGTLYGINTAGAALGAWLTDASLVPRFGIFGTQLVAVAINVVVGVGAWNLSRSAIDTAPSDAREPAEEAPDAGSLVPACIAIALSGFAALGMEIVWFRYLSATIGAFRQVFSIVLTVILVGIWIGASAGAVLLRRYPRPLTVFAASQSLVALTGLVLMASFRAFPLTYAGAVQAIALVVFVPSIFMGLSFPAVNAHVQRELGVVGRRAGTLYLFNTIGSVAGSVVAGFVFAPTIGSQTSFGIFAACAAIAPLSLLVAEHRAAKAPAKAPSWTLVAVVAVAVIAVAAWSALPPRYLHRRFLQALPADDEVVDLKEGTNELVAVVERGAEGRALVTNGHLMSGTSMASQRYMRAFAHVPLLMIPKPDRALVICFGVGSTLHATSLHPSLTRIEIADLSRNVLEHANFFAFNNHGVLEDPRVAVFVQDGRQHLRQQPEGSYDLVTLEPPPISFSGVASLYSTDFYRIVRSRLKPGGFMTQWVPIYDLTPDAGLALVRAFVDVFPASALLSGYAGELILIGTPGPKLELDLDAVQQALRERPAVAADLARIRMGNWTEFVGTFVADGDALREATRGVPPVTDDVPIMEYTFGREPEAPRQLFGHTSGIRAYCPKCFVGDGPDPRVPRLPDYLALLDRVYQTERFRKNVPPAFYPKGPQAILIPESPYLSTLFASAMARAKKNGGTTP